jgi:hypothetical protein
MKNLINWLKNIFKINSSKSIISNNFKNVSTASGATQVVKTASGATQVVKTASGATNTIEK